MLALILKSEAHYKNMGISPKGKKMLDMNLPKHNQYMIYHNTPLLSDLTVRTTHAHGIGFSFVLALPEEETDQCRHRHRQVPAYPALTTRGKY